MLVCYQVLRVRVLVFLQVKHCLWLWRSPGRARSYPSSFLSDSSSLASEADMTLAL